MLRRKTALEEAKECLLCKNAPCSRACPSGIDIPNFIGKVRKEDVDGALEVFMENNPFPGVCGQVCPAPCREKCVRGKGSDEPPQIRDLERYIDEEGIIEIELIGTEEESDIAVVGSGPAGLTAGYFLARDGHRVDIYEELPKAGGMLRYGIPDFRLPRGVLDRDIARIENTGLEIKLDSPVEDIDALFDQGYDAVFVGIGAHKPRWVGIPGEGLERVIHATSFLRKANLGQRVNLGEKVAVVGCGDVALDAVRFANRLGSEAFII